MTPAPEPPASSQYTIPGNIVAAIAYVHLGMTAVATPWPTPADRAAAERLGFLRRAPLWHATERGIGVLVAAGLVHGTPAPPIAVVHARWRVEVSADPDAPPADPTRFVGAGPGPHDPAYHQLLGDDERRLLDSGALDPSAGHVFATTIVQIPVPTVKELFSA
jgi:hypothetical protein